VDNNKLEDKNNKNENENELDDENKQDEPEHNDGLADEAANMAGDAAGMAEEAANNNDNDGVVQETDEEHVDMVMRQPTTHKMRTRLPSSATMRLMTPAIAQEWTTAIQMTNPARAQEWTTIQLRQLRTQKWGKLTLQRQQEWGAARSED
jgi:hypothetical protein